MYVNSRTSTSNQAQAKTKDSLAYNKKAQQFVKEATQTLNKLASHTATPAQQSQALNQTKKVLTDARQIVQMNSDTAITGQQSQALDALMQETQAVKTSVDKAVVLGGRSEDPEKALRPLKAQFLQKLVTGLASDMPQVRQNARQALSQLGVSQPEMEHLRLVVEQQKMQKQQNATRFAGSQFPVKLHTPQGIKFAGNLTNLEQDYTLAKDLETLNKCSSWIGADPLANSILDRVMNEHSFNYIADQAVSYQVNNIAGQLLPILFTGGQEIQLHSGQILTIGIGDDRPADAKVIRTW